MVYYANFDSKMRYGMELWGSANKSGNIFVLQKKAIRIMLKKGRRVHCRPLFRKLKILTFYSLYIFLTAIKMKEQQDSLTKRNEVHTHLTRNNDNVYTAACKTTTAQKLSGYCDIKLYNKLPKKIKMSNFKDFKRLLKEMLMEKCYYSVKEFMNDNFS
jgi:hypothetical protein